MARTQLLFFIFIIIFFFFFHNNVQSETQHPFSQTLKPSKMGLKREKLSHLHFYFHDIPSGHNPTAVLIAKPASNASMMTGFGSMLMIDDPLTLGPSLKSKLVGKAQGVYGMASQGELGLLMVINFCFIEGKYNGSTLSILGRNRVFSDVREMPVVGGSGLFRFARGYAQAHTHSVNFTTGDAVVEYNVFVFHY